MISTTTEAGKKVVKLVSTTETKTIEDNNRVRMVIADLDRPHSIETPFGDFEGGFKLPSKLNCVGFITDTTYKKIQKDVWKYKDGIYCNTCNKTLKLSEVQYYKTKPHCTDTKCHHPPLVESFHCYMCNLYIDKHVITNSLDGKKITPDMFRDDLAEMKEVMAKGNTANKVATYTPYYETNYELHPYARGVYPFYDEQMGELLKLIKQSFSRPNSDGSGGVDLLMRKDFTDYLGDKHYAIQWRLKSTKLAGFTVSFECRQFFKVIFGDDKPSNWTAHTFFFRSEKKRDKAMNYIVLHAKYIVNGSLTLDETKWEPIGENPDGSPLHFRLKTK